MCVPAWDSDAVFSALLGGPGAYAIEPVGRYVWGGHYEPDSLIWRSRWSTETGIVECREALAFPGDPRLAVVLRRVIAVDGDAEVEVRFDARAGFGQHQLVDLRNENGIWTARTGPIHLRYVGAAQAQRTRGGGLAFRLQVPAGQHHDFVLELAEGRLPSRPVVPSTAWESTERAWRECVPTLDESLAAGDAQRAYAVLRGLTSASGGMAASATASLPERADEGRDYDYRYAWIRDQCLTGQAIAAAGPYPLLDDAVRFVSGRILDDGPQLAPAYTVAGGPIPGQRSLGLPGYPGGRDLVGNRARAQFQLDAFGESLLLLAAAARHERLDKDGWRAAGIAAGAVADRWREHEAGIWELDPQYWTESRLICVAGLRAISRAGHSSSETESWESLAKTILADTSRRCTHRSGRWQRTPTDERPDAALLLPIIHSTSPGDSDPHTQPTIHAIRDELGVDNFMYRFRHSAGRLGEDEGAFLLCGFLMALTEHRFGDEASALRWFERNRAACGSPGLFAEEYDVIQRQLRGNLPQAFVHALLLEASVRLAGPGGHRE